MSESTATAPQGLDEILERARSVARSDLAPAAADVDNDALWPRMGIEALQAAGLGGLNVPPQHGGLGRGLFGLVRVCEILAEECASTALCFGMHCVGAAVISAKATADQSERYLRPISRGEHLTTLALSEPGSGSHFYFPQTRIERQRSGDFRVTGGKSFVTNGGHADSYVISTAGGDAEPGLFSCLLLDSGTAGLEWGEPWRGLGMRGNDSRSVELAGVDVRKENLLGGEGDELWYVFNVIAPYFLVAMAGTYLGVAAAALAEARLHLGRRSYAATGRGPADEPVVQHRLGSIWTRLEAARRLTYSAAASADADPDAALPAILGCKAEVGDVAVAVTNEAMTLTGGIAYAENAKLHRHLRDARAAHVMGPTTDVLRTWTGRALLGQPLLAR